MNKKFRKVSNGIDGLRTEIASLQDGLVHKGLRGRRHVRRTISPLVESITKNID
jgi:hypothetical protein